MKRLVLAKFFDEVDNGQRTEAAEIADECKGWLERVIVNGKHYLLVCCWYGHGRWG